MPYSSKDFNQISSHLRPHIPQRLIHPNLMKHNTTKDLFSIERKHFVNIADLPSSVISMTFGQIEPLQQTRRHRHNYETLIYIIAGFGKTMIETNEINWQAGDAIYIPVWAWHHHCNLNSDDQATYIACENAPLLQNLSNIALREEWDDTTT